LVFFSLNPTGMANVTLIKDLASNLIMALDKHSSPQDIIEGFEDALDAYEELICTYHQK
jgi:hypothetical protein